MRDSLDNPLKNGDYVWMKSSMENLFDKQHLDMVEGYSSNGIFIIVKNISMNDLALSGIKFSENLLKLTNEEEMLAILER